ncbi:MAG: alpha/beta hydrolase family esterase [Allosphingosinicella sp.]
MPVITPRLRRAAPRRGASGFAPKSAVRDRLSDLGAFGANPGNLVGRYYVPEGLEPGAPLVVVLHGCTQNAAVYDHGSGWSRLADRHGFALLFPEQQRANNAMLCFNWFESGDVRRGGGEAASIAAMVAKMRSDHGVDPDRISVTGLSAGGAMAAAMLAAYPDLFAAGAIIAGVAYGCATSVAQAFDCMGGRAEADPRALGDKVRRASPHNGPWPRVQLWQGGADRTVVPGNADAIAAQWADVHGLDPARPDRDDKAPGHRRRVWTGAGGAALVERYDIAGMAHGVPLDPGTGDGRSGEAGAHMLDVGLSSTDRIAEFFGIAAGDGARGEEPRAEAESVPPRLREGVRERAQEEGEAAQGIQRVIEDALKAAGLMR